MGIFSRKKATVHTLSIYSVLKHRADISRRQATYVDGEPQFSYVPVAQAVRTFFQPEDCEEIQSSTISYAISTKAYALFHPSADLAVGDTLTLLPPLSGRYTVTGRIDHVPDPTGNGVDHLRAYLEPVAPRPSVPQQPAAALSEAVA